MPIRITGLNSGLDTESIISALVSSYNYKTNKYKKAQTKLSWKQDAWKSLNTKIYSLYNSVGNMRFSNAYNVKKTTVSDNTKVSIAAGSTSTNGSYSIQVTSLAKSGYLTGGKLAAGTTSATTLKELGYTGTDGKMTLTIGGKEKDISVTADTTVQELVNQLKEAGVGANYDAVNNRIFVSAKETGAANDFSLIGANANGNQALSVLGLQVASTANTAEYEELASYYGKDFQAIVQAKADATADNARKNTENANYQKAIAYGNAVAALRTTGEGKDAKEYELLKSLASMESLEKTYVDADGNLYTYEKETNQYVTTKVGTDEKVSVSATDIENDALYTKAADKYDELAKSFGLITEKTAEDGSKTEDKTALSTFQTNLATVKNTAEDAQTNANTELQTMLDQIEAAASTDEINAMVASHETAMAANKASIKANDALLADNAKLTADMTAEDLAAFADKVAYAKDVVDGKIDLSGSYSAGATRVNGADATIYVNGAEYTGTSNVFSINGMTITATGVTGSAYDPTESAAVTATVNTDAQGIYDKIKDFLTQYNAIINEMTSLYNADSAKGYEPLTDEEKEAMSEAEVEKWEEKIKTSLLRRDDTLSGLISSMTNAMAKGIDVNGEKVYFSTFGIKTLGLFNAAKNEQNAYHIDGDEDDVTTSGNADKLMAAISAEPEKVMEFMQGMAQNLYNAVDTKMKSSSLSSVYTVYNDKEMDKEYKSYTELIEKWQERLEKQQDYYYEKFAAMETALSKLNSQTSSLTGLFGN